MGRVAESVARAARRRADGYRLPDRLALPFTDTAAKWVDWYGVAQSPPSRSSMSRDPNDDGAAVSEDSEDPVPVAGLSPDAVSYYERSSLISEQYRSLRTRLLSAQPQRVPGDQGRWRAKHDHRVYAVSSAVPKEGKSVTTLNLSLCMAEIRHNKVLMVDGDFRRSALAEMIHADGQPGLADFLRNDASYSEIIKPTVVPNLYFVPAGRTRGRSAPELLSTPVAREVFARFRREFHCTIVDTPPATSVADVGIIGQYASGVILVIRMHRTSEPLARRAVRHLAGNNVCVVGSLLVGEDLVSSGYGRRYNYYRYYGKEPK